MNKKVFVYGSLMSGMGNHGLLAKAKFLGDAFTPEGFQMLDLGWFPGAFKAKEGRLVGEIYEVDEMTLARLDRLEGYNHIDPSRGMYDRVEIETDFGTAYIYTYNRAHSDHLPEKGVVGGDWRTHYSRKNRF